MRVRHSTWPGSTRHAGMKRTRCISLASFHAHADPPDVVQAEAHYQQALSLAEALSMRPLVAHCHYGLGWLYGQTGRGEEACVALATAISLYHVMDMTFWLPQAEAALAQEESNYDL